MLRMSYCMLVSKIYSPELYHHLIMDVVTFRIAKNRKKKTMTKIMQDPKRRKAFAAKSKVHIIIVISSIIIMLCTSTSFIPCSTLLGRFPSQTG